jgi:chaperonin GroEL
MDKRKMQPVVFQPTAYQGMRRGINQMVAAIRPTLGPRPRLVAIDPVVRSNSVKPELLDNGGVIARRIIQLPDRDEDMGAMFLRNMLCRLHDDVGDGTATAAVLFQAIFNQGVRYVVAGGNAVRLRHYLEQGMCVILNELNGMTLRPKQGKAELAKIAEAICSDPPLAKILGEIFDIIGEYGRLEVRTGSSRALEREYVAGSYWDSSLLSRYMVTDQARQRAELENAAILISDLDLQDPHDLVPVLTAAMQAGVESLVIMARTVSDRAIGILLANQKAPQFRVMAIKAPGTTVDDVSAALEDLAVLTGGRPCVAAAGDTLERAKLQDLGHARQAWADQSHFGIVAGRGNPRALRAHLANLRTAHKNAKDPDVRKRLQQRLGRLMGGSATLWVGGATETEVKVRNELVERTADVLRGAVREGLLPGGGAALLACRPAMRCLLDGSTEEDERAAYRILLRALEEPLRTIVANAGYDAADVMAEIKQVGASRSANSSAFYGFDVISGQVVDTVKARILDVAPVQKAAVRCAIASAALGLTIDVLVHHKKPELDYTPK